MVLLVNFDDPTVGSILFYLGWLIAEIYFGKAPSYPHPAEPFVFQHARFIYLAVIILLIAGIFWSVYHLRRWNRQRDKYNHRLKRFLIHVLIPLIVDISLINIYTFNTTSTARFNNINRSGFCTRSGYYDYSDSYTQYSLGDSKNSPNDANNIQKTELLPSNFYK